MPEDEKKSALCPICDSPVEIDAKKCPECQADLTVFGVKTGEEETSDANIQEYDDSLEKLLGKIGEKDEQKEHELFEEIMAVVDKTDEIPKTEDAVESEAALESGAAEASGGEVVEEAPASAVMFECPLCNTLVSEDATSCPGCGAIFAEPEGEAASGGAEAAESQEAPGIVEETVAAEEEYAPATAEMETPPEAVPPEETVAPVEEASTESAVETYEPETPPTEEVAEKPKRKFSLGKKKKKERVAEERASAAPERPPTAVKDERSLHRELTTCVSEVKPLLAVARQFEINVFEGRKLIDQAITAGKKRNFEKAIDLVKTSKKTIEDVINQYIGDSLQTTQVKINAIKKAGGDAGGLEKKVIMVQTLLDEKRIIQAVEIAKTVSEETEKSVMKLKSVLKTKERSEKGKDVAEKLKALIELIKSGEQVKVNVKGAKSLLTQARVAIKKNELARAEELLVDAKEDFLKELPKQLADIISNSKPVLYKAKMQGVDIRPSIKLLKEASTALKLNDYLDALGAIKQYKTEMYQYLN